MGTLNASAVRTQLLDVRNLSIRLAGLNSVSSAEYRAGKFLEFVDEAILALGKVETELELIDLEVSASEAEAEIVRQTNKRNFILAQIEEKRNL